MYVRITQMTRGMAIQILCIYCKSSDACVTKDGPNYFFVPETRRGSLQRKTFITRK